MININVRGGTVHHSGSSLCASCSRAAVIKGETQQETITVCRMLDREMTFKVTSCNEYCNASEPALHEMQVIAWRLLTDKSGKIGFLSSDKFDAACTDGKAKGDDF